jgi:hypothetical protein
MVIYISQIIAIAPDDDLFIAQIAIALNQTYPCDRLSMTQIAIALDYVSPILNNCDRA